VYRRLCLCRAQVGRNTTHIHRPSAIPLRLCETRTIQSMRDTGARNQEKNPPTPVKRKQNSRQARQASGTARSDFRMVLVSSSSSDDTVARVDQATVASCALGRQGRYGSLAAGVASRLPVRNSLACRGYHSLCSRTMQSIFFKLLCRVFIIIHNKSCYS
jgi:hypothetical protein